MSHNGITSVNMNWPIKNKEHVQSKAQIAMTPSNAIHQFNYKLESI